MECSICLEIINDNDKKILSCNHSFHANCYLKCVKTNNYNSFIKCPLCREINVDTSLPFSDSRMTLELLHERKRCKGITKNGTRCKCKSSIFSRYCHNHETVLIDKKEYVGDIDTLLKGLKLVGDYMDKTILKPNNINFPIIRSQFIDSLK